MSNPDDALDRLMLFGLEMVFNSPVNSPDCFEVKCSECKNPECKCWCHVRHETIDLDQMLDRERAEHWTEEEGDE